MSSKATLLRESPARGRILEAAILRFARHSYHDTSLRDIAADAGVDVAYVHRCFGSKQRLFAEVVRRSVGPSPLSGDAVTASACIPVLTGRVFAREPLRSDQVDTLQIVSRSMMDPEAANILRQCIRDHVLTPLAERIGDISGKRAALVTAFLAGATLFRNVIGLEELQERQGGELEALVAAVLATVVTGGKIAQ